MAHDPRRSVRHFSPENVLDLDHNPVSPHKQGPVKLSQNLGVAPSRPVHRAGPIRQPVHGARVGGAGSQGG